MKTRAFIVGQINEVWTVRTDTNDFSSTFKTRRAALSAAITFAATSSRAGINARVIDLSEGRCRTLWTAGRDGFSGDA